MEKKKQKEYCRKGRPKQVSDHLIKLSLFLDSIKARLFEIYLDLKLTRDELSVEKIKNIYRNHSVLDILM